MSEKNEKFFEVRWSDLDANFHVRHSAYADYCATARLQVLADHGFSMAEFLHLRMGPVLFKETLEYSREIPPNAKVRVSMKVSGASSDGRKWKIRHELHRVQDNIKAATVEVEGAWMNTATRKIVAPPEDLKKVFDSLEKTEDFSVLP